MSFTVIVLAIVATFIILIVAIVAHKRVPRKLKVDQFVLDWKELQTFCKDKETWSNAIASADKLFDKALKRRRFKGKSMGERMVSAQRSITNNDQMWYAHNFSKKVLADPAMKLKESEVKQALIGFRQALKDIGALHTAETIAAAEAAVGEQKSKNEK